MTDHASISDAPLFTMRLDARAEHLMLVRQAIEGALAPLGADDKLVGDIKLAVTEACSNVVKYAYGGDSGPMAVSLARVGPDLQIVVRDFGVWRVNDDSPPDEISGMGIPLIKSVAASQEISHRPDGTEVSMVFAMNGGASVSASGSDTADE